MNNIFCIISAIGNDYGIFSYQERLNQLKNTIESVRTYAPGSDIVIYDASEDPLPNEDLNLLKSLVNQVTVLNEDTYVKFLKFNSKDPTPNKFEKKSIGEIQATIAFLEFLKTHPIKYKRVFKIAGRYNLNENFNLYNYESERRCVFVEKENWYGKMVFPIRLWSFDYDQVDFLLHIFYNIQKHTYDLVTETKKFEIIEYTFTKFLEKFQVKCVEVKPIGLSGLSGLNASVINE